MGKRYAKKERRTLINEIKACRQQKMSRQQIVDHLNAMGLTTATGKPWDLTVFSGFCNHYRLTRNDVRSPRASSSAKMAIAAHAETKKTNTSLEIVRSILDSDLTIQVQREIIASLVRDS